MVCTVCKYPHSHVFKTWKSHDNLITYRRHMCTKCLFRFTTIERQKEYKRKGEYELYRELGK